MYCPNPECIDARRIGLPGEYRGGVKICSKCGSNLVDELPTWARKRDDEVLYDSADCGPYVLIVELDNTALVPVAKSLLAAAGIHYYVRDEKSQHLIMPHFAINSFDTFLKGPCIMVEAARADEARALLADLDDSACADADAPDQE